jgi:hypothetical protein
MVATLGQQVMAAPQEMAGQGVVVAVETSAAQHIFLQPQEVAGMAAAQDLEQMLHLMWRLRAEFLQQ